MKIGLIPISPSQSVLDADILLAYAQEAEARGFDSLWATEHILWETPRLDPYALLAAYAALTSRVELGIGISVLPLHNPAYIAKVVSTIDHLSHGRAILGVGIGEHSPREFTAFGIRPEERGRRVEEGVGIIRRLWTEGRVDHLGEFYRLEDAIMEPKPVRGTVPIWVGGTSGRALRRAASLGDGWYGFRSSPDDAAAAIATIRLEAGRLGRDLRSFTFALQVNCVVAETEQAARRLAVDRNTAMSRTWGRIGPRLLASFEDHTVLGVAEAVAEGLIAYRQAGVEHLAVRLIAGEDHTSAVRVFAEEILPRIRET